MNNFNPPWKDGPLSEWRLSTMFHWKQSGELMLSVGMRKGGRYITEEGIDDEYLWNRLCHKAWKIDALENPE